MFSTWKKVLWYKNKDTTHLETTELNKGKTGVRLEGDKAINPVNGREVEIFLGDSTDSRGEYSDSKGEAIIMLLSKLRAAHLSYASIKWNT